jgi:hypothetical protein
LYCTITVEVGIVPVAQGAVSTVKVGRGAVPFYIGGGLSSLNRERARTIQKSSGCTVEQVERL